MKSWSHRDKEIGVKHWLNTSADPFHLVAKTREGYRGEKEVPVPRRTCGESGYVCAFCLCACGCFACCDHSDHCARMTCCSGASHGLCPCRCLRGCPPHRPCPNGGPWWFDPESPASGSNCGFPRSACSQTKNDTQIKNEH